MYIKSLTGCNLHAPRGATVQKKRSYLKFLLILYFSPEISEKLRKQKLSYSMYLIYCHPLGLLDFLNVCEFVRYCVFNPALEVLKLTFKWGKMDGKEVQLLTDQSHPSWLKQAFQG